MSTLDIIKIVVIAVVAVGALIVYLGKDIDWKEWPRVKKEVKDAWKEGQSDIKKGAIVILVIVAVLLGRTTMPDKVTIDNIAFEDNANGVQKGLTGLVVALSNPDITDCIIFKVAEVNDDVYLYTYLFTKKWYR